MEQHGGGGGRWEEEEEETICRAWFRIISALRAVCGELRGGVCKGDSLPPTPFNLMFPSHSFHECPQCITVHGGHTLSCFGALDFLEGQRRVDESERAQWTRTALCQMSTWRQTDFLLLWGKQLPLNKLPVATRVVLWWRADIGDVDISPSKDAGCE